MLNVLMSCNITCNFKLLNVSIHPFLLCVGCAFNDIFIYWDAKRIVLVRFLFGFYVLIDLDVTQLDYNNSDLILKWARFEVLR